MARKKASVEESKMAALEEWLKALGPRALPGETSFFGCPFAQDLAGADAVALGIPFDLGTSNRPGARFGAQGMREVSMFYANGEITKPDFFSRHKVLDAGDVRFFTGDMDNAMKAIELTATAILEQGPKLISLGGDHTVSLPLLRAHAKKFGKGLALIHFDSHTDTYDIYPKSYHGSPFAQAEEEGLIDPAKVVHLGIRTDMGGFESTKGHTVLSADWMLENGMKETIKMVREVVGRKKTYITFDIDFLDPAYAPGTGTPVVGGPTTAQARQLLRGFAGLNVIGADVVEVAPIYDGPGQITSLAGAAMAYYMLELMLD
jgi:agmatinase